MSTIQIVKASIIDLDVDCIVNAANDRLQAGSGVCGAIFKAAGYEQLQKACNRIGGCKTGGAVITPGFNLKQKYIVHAVGPIWHGGQQNERHDLYYAYYHSLEVAKENGCTSIGFPLISTGVYGYPSEEAWSVALNACFDYLKKNRSDYYGMDIQFAVLDEDRYQMGIKELEKQQKEYDAWCEYSDSQPRVLG